MSKLRPFRAALWLAACPLIGLPSVAAAGNDPVGALMIAAAARGDRAQVQDLLDHGVRVDSVDAKTGRTALMAASAAGKESVVELLLWRGADPTKRDAGKHRALDLAVTNGRRACAVVLLEYLAQTEVASYNDRLGLSTMVDGRTAPRLHYTAEGGSALLALAVARGDRASLEALLASGVSSDATSGALVSVRALTDRWGHSAFMPRGDSGHTDSLTDQTRAGTDTSSATVRAAGSTPIDD